MATNLVISKKNPENDSDKKISIALMASFVILAIQYFVLISFNLFETAIGSTVQMLSKVLVGLAYLYALPKVLRRNLIKTIVIYMVAMFIFILHYAIFPENRAYIFDLIVPFFFMSLPAFIYTLSIKNFEVFEVIMKKSSYIVFLFGALIGILVFTDRASAGSYSMALSYYMLLPTIMFTDELIDKFSVRIASFVGLSLLVILALGSRGAVLCVIVFAFLKIIKSKEKLTYKRALTYLGLCGIGVISYINLEKILESMYLIFLNFGIRSRSILLFLRDEVHLSGRESIYDSLIVELVNNPVLGIGIGGDRLIRSGGYAHNLFLEIFIDFGLILGAIITVFLLAIIVKCLLIKNRERYSLFIIWLSLGFVHLMVSSTYITDIKFWIFLGVSFNLLRRQCIKTSFNFNINKIIPRRLS